MFARPPRHALAVVCAAVAVGATASPVSVPPDLEPWRAWVLQDEDFRQCPFVSSTPAKARDAFRCAWPERLVLALAAQGGTFEQGWLLFADAWVRLPGSTEHWPQDIRVDAHPAAVVARDGAPQLWLTRGTHLISGRLSFAARPELLEIDTRTAIIELTLDGHRVAQPERPSGALWLGKQRTAAQPQRLGVEVYRLLRDEVPARLTTLVRLEVSGDGREELLSQVLPDGFVPMSIESELPARLEPDGRLRVQVRAGSWDITLNARGADVASQLALPPIVPPWPREEVWSFAGDDRLRVAVAEGAPGIDPAQAGVPPEWRQYPAFRMTPEVKLAIVERARGLSHSDENRLTLERHLWLDFERGGLTAVDNLRGAMRHQWRLETAAPFELESARTNGETLLITRNRDDPGSGVEVRAPELTLLATSRAPRARGTLPATGWKTRFERVSGELIVPPGHLLLAVLGADRSPGAWIERWGLWSLFGVLIVAVFAGRLAGWPVGVIALVALLLTYQEGPGHIWLWTNLIAAIALAGAAPEGRLRSLAERYRLLSFLVLGIALLPFLVGQLRLALYPQLEPWVELAAPAVPPRVRAAAAPEAPPPAAATTTVPEAKLGVPERPEELAQEEEKREEEPYAKNVVVEAAKVAGVSSPLRKEPRYAAGTQLQAGPGIPAWRYRSYPFSWSGPVEPTQTVRFVYLGRVALALWRIAGVALLVILFLALLRPGGWAEAGKLLAQLRGGTATALALMLAVAAMPAARAAATPDPALLAELKTRLTRAPECLPSCFEISAATITAGGEALEIALDVSALANIAVPMPSAGDHWQLESVTLDGRSALALEREGDGTLWVPLGAGVHSVRLSGPLASAQSIQLAFPKPPRRVSVSADAWEVAGVNAEGRLISDSLEFVRRSARGRTPSGLEAASEFPAFVAVGRHVDLGLDWRLTTTVTRLAPAEATLNLEVPLVAQEAVLSQQLPTRALPDGQRVAIVGLERGQKSLEWTSALSHSDSLEFALPAGAPRTEVWSFRVSPQWNVTFEGPPAVLPENLQGAAAWVYEFHPRAGEHLLVHVRRPEATPGATLAIDSVGQRFAFGKRSADGSLRLVYRSTQGGRHPIRLPEDARIARIALDGQPLQLRPERGELPLGLLPGTHELLIEWTSAQPATFVTRTPAIDLRVPASNIRTTLTLPADRWALLAFGPGVGPAILYWGELVLFVIGAVLLGRSGRSPLRTHEWLLLGVGLSTLSWAVLALVGIWLFAMRWRAGWTAQLPAWQFNALQVLLAILTVAAVSALVFVGIRESLLSRPDMGVRGGGSAVDTFGWFLDEIPSGLPRCTVFSVPMWVYRAVMFAWALWVVVALLRWLKGAWQAWKTNGIWRGQALSAPPA